MDINDLRSLVTVVSFLVFVGIILWACSPRRRQAFEEAAQLALDEDSPRAPADASPRRATS